MKCCNLTLQMLNCISMYKQRLISDKIQHLRSLYGAILVTGPRQTGKTTLCRELFPNHQWVLLDDEGILGLAKGQPDLFLQNFPAPVIFDEVQRATGIFLAIKNHLDLDKIKIGAPYVLTGSQPLSLMRSVSESLAGRVGIVDILPMTHSEIYGSDAFRFSFQQFIEGKVPVGQKVPMGAPIQEILFRGGFPDIGIASLSPTWDDVAVRLSSYVRTYLHRDLRDLSLVQDLSSFEKFLRRFALSSATSKGPSDWASEVGKPRSTIQSWMGLLLASYIAFEMPAFSMRLGRREKKASKFHLVDSGLMSHLLAYQSPDQLFRSPLLGQIFETYGLSSFRAWTQRSSMPPALYHWRLDEKEEVDLVFELADGEVVAVEFKLTSKPNADDLNGIRAFQKAYPKCQRAILVSCFETVSYLDKNILNIPVSAL